MTKGKLHLSFDITSLKGADYNPRRIDAAKLARFIENLKGG